MKAIAISNFPNDINETKFLPEFEARGFKEVKFVTGPQMRDITVPNDVDVIFCFFDLMSHGQYDYAKVVAKKAKKRLVLLNRKTSSWPEETFEQITPKENNEMPPPKSVRDEDVTALFQEYVDLCEEGVQDEKKIIARMQKFWSGRPLTSHRQMINYMDRLITEKKAPKIWFDYLNTKKSEKTNSANSQITDAVTAVNDQITDAVTQSIDPKNKEVEISNDELIKMYEDDNVRLTDRVKELTQNEEVLKTTIKDLQARTLDRASTKAFNPKVVDALNTLIEAQLIDYKQAFESLLKAVKNG